MSESIFDRLDRKGKILQQRIDAEAKAKRPLTTDQFSAANHKFPDGTTKPVEKAKPTPSKVRVTQWAYHCDFGGVATFSNGWRVAVDEPSWQALVCAFHNDLWIDPEPYRGLRPLALNEGVMP